MTQSLWRLEFTTNHVNEVKDWVLQWGGAATALAPAVLVDKVKQGIRQAAANYE
jgi:predicted DNA-binding transcriptional regulator YafY